MTTAIKSAPPPHTDAATELRDEAQTWADYALSGADDFDRLDREYHGKLEVLTDLYGPAAKDYLDAAMLAKAKRKLALLSDVATRWASVAGIEPEELVPASLGDKIVSAATIGIMEDVTVDYLWEPFVPRGVKVELTARVKVGKTDLATDLAGCVARGARFCDRPTRQARVLYLSEQSPRVTRRYLARAGLLDCHEFRVLFRSDIGRTPWPALCADVAEYVREQSVGLVVIDTLTAWSGMTGDDENNSGDAQAVVDKLDIIVSAGATVLTLRHSRKGGGAIGESARGSSAFGGAMDVLLSLERMPGGGQDNRRELQAVSRLDEVPSATVIERGEDGYSIIGESRQVAHLDAERAVLAALPIRPDAALDVDAIMSVVPDAKRSLISDILKCNCDEGGVSREKGAGAASPRAYGYWLAPRERPSA